MAQPEATTPTRTHAVATIAVDSHESHPFEQSAGPALLEISITESFVGDIDGRSTVRALQVRDSTGSASQVSMQRFVGALGGRKGSFVLQGSGTVADGKVNASWFVVPGSGTGGLVGLRGEGGFDGVFGKGSRGMLDYWFE
jgi:hypothetical protein